MTKSELASQISKLKKREPECFDIVVIEELLDAAFQLGITITTAPSKKEDLAILCELYEVAALNSIRTNNLPSFESFCLILQNIYFDFCFESERMPLLIGLMLMYFLSNGRISDFHTLLQRISCLPKSNFLLSNPNICYPLTIEQALMEGSFALLFKNLLLMDENTKQGNIASFYFHFFSNPISDTVRKIIAKACESSYSSPVSIDTVCRILFLSIDNLEEFCNQHNWKIDKSTNTVTMQTSCSPSTCSDERDFLDKQFLSKSLKRNIYYATQVNKLI